MSINNALASLAVKDLEAAIKWYEGIFGRPPLRPMPAVAEWFFAGGGGLQIYKLPERAGSGSCTLATTSVDEVVAQLAKLNIDSSQRTSSDRVRTAMITDPDGNHLAFAEPIRGDDGNMTWVGKWRNQYGSILDITDDANHRIVGTFRTALEDSGFFGQEIEIVGVHSGNCISAVGGGVTRAGNAVVSYTGLFRGGRMETLWYVAADAALVASAEGEPARLEKLNWWRSISTNADTFERMS